MDLVPTLVNALVVMLVGGVVTWVTRTQIRDLKEEIRDLRSEVRAEIASIRAEMRAEFASVHSDITQIALAIGTQARPQTG